MDFYFREKIRRGREEANSLQLWKEKSWTPLLFYVHWKASTIGIGLGFAMGILSSVLIHLLINGPH